MKNKFVVFLGFLSLCCFCFSYLFETRYGSSCYSSARSVALDRMIHRSRCKLKKSKVIRKNFDARREELQETNEDLRLQIQDLKEREESLKHKALAPSELGSLQAKLLGHSAEGKWKLESMKSFPGFLGEFETHYMDLRFSGQFQMIHEWLKDLSAAELPVRVIHLHIGKKEHSDEAILEVGIETMIHPQGKSIVK